MYPYMAVASCAHISMYWASVAAIAALFCPKKLVAMNVVNRTRFARMTGGGTGHRERGLVGGRRGPGLAGRLFGQRAPRRPANRRTA